MENKFIELVNDYRALIFKVCNLYCRDPESCKDLFQEVVLQLWKSYAGFRHESANSTWIYKVALNTAISNLRKENRSLHKKPLDLEELEIPDLSIATDENESRMLLHQAIDRLSEIEKAIILLYLDEKSYDEISEIIGISTSNVGVRLNRIKNKLNKTIKTN
ncbi:RNA polymerase sigma factor [Terrimonas pollutisoli]|uniref:RNA polymerase sigma factor n=1 Tax=Terrimonas pollutisoli TaxID=3034147 RepID=UPI0023EC490E|nr:sigma-70 family RNA polymerase sigma factor [Terrimonas sp. H1YJ31]